jgi:hypothetical protein
LEEGFDRSDDNEDQRQPVDGVDGEVGRENEPVSHRAALMTRQGRLVSTRRSIHLDFRREELTH